MIAKSTPKSGSLKIKFCIDLHQYLNLLYNYLHNLKFATCLQKVAQFVKFYQMWSRCSCLHNSHDLRHTRACNSAGAFGIHFLDFFVLFPRMDYRDETVQQFYNIALCTEWREVTKCGDWGERVDNLRRAGLDAAHYFSVFVNRWRLRGRLLRQQSDWM